jgi:hypothetical protein
MYVNSISILNVHTADQLEGLAYVVIVLTLAGLCFLAFGTVRVVRSYRTDSSTPRTIAVIGQVLDGAKYRSVMTAATLAYGIVFALVSGIIVYRPTENFATEYLVSIPSTIMAVCCGSPGFIPVLTVYLTNHLGLLIIPADIVILVLVSGLVGLNMTLVICQYENRPRKAPARWFLGVGAACGLFTACPTCAGLLLSATILSVGSSAMILLSGLQPFFILATVLALATGIGLNARSLPIPSYPVNLAQGLREPKTYNTVNPTNDL